MKCEKCGLEIPDNSRFCNSCGAKQRATARKNSSKTGDLAFAPKKYEATDKPNNVNKRNTALLVIGV